MDQRVEVSVHDSEVMNKDTSAEMELGVAVVVKNENIDIEEKQSTFIVHHAMTDTGTDLLADLAEQETKNVQPVEEMVCHVADVGDTSKQEHCCPSWLVSVADRISGILEVPTILVFGILLYLVDIGSDIVAGVTYLGEGHLAWGFLTIGFVLFSSGSCAAFSWTYWYYDRERDVAYRRRRMILAVLVLEPLVRYGSIVTWHFVLLVRTLSKNGLCGFSYIDIMIWTANGKKEIHNSYS